MTGEEVPKDNGGDEAPVNEEGQEEEEEKSLPTLEAARSTWVPISRHLPKTARAQWPRTLGGDSGISG